MKPPVFAVAKCNLVHFGWLGTQSQYVYDSIAYLMNIISTQRIPCCRSPLCLQSQRMASVGYSLCGRKIPTCLWFGNYLILPGISIFNIDSPLQNARNLCNVWSYVSCKGVQRTLVADHFDNAGFNAIAKSSLLESMHIINQEKTPKWVSRLQCCHVLFGIILPYFCFLMITFKCVYCLQWLHCSLVLFDGIFTERPGMLPVHYLTLYKTCKPKRRVGLIYKRHICDPPTTPRKHTSNRQPQTEYVSYVLP